MRTGTVLLDAGMEELLRGAGLVDVRTASRTVVVTFRDADRLLEFSWLHGQRAVWEAVPESEHPEVRRQLADLKHDLAETGAALSPRQCVRYTVGRRQPA